MKVGNDKINHVPVLYILVVEEFVASVAATKVDSMVLIIFCMGFFPLLVWAARL